MPAPAAAWAAISEAMKVSRSPGSSTTAAEPVDSTAWSSWPAEARRPGPEATTTAPASRSSAPMPGPAAHATTASGAGCSRVLTWVAKWVIRMRSGPARGHARLDGRARVVDVHVHVPQVGATHHEQRVAEPVERRASGSRPPAAVVSVSRYITS